MEEEEEELERKCDDWLINYIEYTEGQESPDIFHLWCGISAIAACLARDTWLDRVFYTLYPNLYIILVGASGETKKTTAIEIAEGFVRAATPDINILTQKMTTESMMNQIATKKEGESSVGYILSEELSVTLGRASQDMQFIVDLTKMYNCNKVFDYGTMARGKDTALNVCLNMLGGTTPQWIKASIPENAIGGGFTSRVIFVYQPPGGKVIAHPKLTPRMEMLRGLLINDLRVISELKGEWKFSEDAYDWFEEWYGILRSSSVEEDTLRGYFGRKDSTLLKLAMVFAASKRNDLIIGEEDLTTALKALNANERFLPKVMHGIQRTSESDLVDKVFSTLRKLAKDSMAEWVQHSQLFRAISWKVGDAESFRKLISTLIQQGLIEEGIHDGARYYKERK